MGLSEGELGVGVGQVLSGIGSCASESVESVGATWGLGDVWWRGVGVSGAGVRGRGWVVLGAAVLSAGGCTVGLWSGGVVELGGGCVVCAVEIVFGCVWRTGG